MEDKFAVIGMGQFGTRVAKQLTLRGAEVLAIDRNIERVEQIKDDVTYAVALDSTDIKALSTQSIQEMDAVLVAIGENIEGLLLTVVLLLELDVKRIVARAMSQEQKIILEKLGVEEILSPEDEVGMMVAEMLLKPTMKAFLPLPDGYEIAEIQVPRKAVNKTVGELNLPGKYQLVMVTIKRQFEENMKGRPTIAEHLVHKIQDDTILQPSDMLIVMGKNIHVDKFIELNS
ncbi:TrkA family potassium uptake protein [Flammeovirgaceae bacterium SG7u.111]|nr:TrkA family potassium uptake protein [Flammeovirgaceae bacterium SG7u.132]WPO36573.1 TrkA family potassium uptake protein [Flammeovirgaceae bacterium SG7u.111]